MVDNELCVGNYAFKQNVNYTFKRNNVCSYIDYMFLPHYLLNKIVKCSVLHDCEDNVSDHLAISAQLQISVPLQSATENWSPAPAFPQGNWDNLQFQCKYSAETTKALDNIPVVDISSISHMDAKDTINKLCNTLCSTLHKCVQGCLPNHSPKKKPLGKSWWNHDCTITKQRNRLFHLIWKESGRPVSGLIYECYKATKKNFRRACRLALSAKAKLCYSTIDKLHKAKDSRRMWNVIKHAKSTPLGSDGINLESLSDYYCEKFAAKPHTSPVITASQSLVCEKYKKLTSGTVKPTILLSEQLIRRYIKRLKNNTAPGLDGITSEHLKYGLNSSLPVHLSVLLTLCFRFGIVPDSFSMGVLVPILKKPNLNPAKAKNYRPITVSPCLSKIMEYYILDQCTDYQFSHYQFGFLPQRSTAMAASLVHDVSEFCNAQGSTVYLCSLDAEGAFDNIPFPVLFHCASNVLPDLCWRVMYYWYSQMRIYPLEQPPWSLYKGSTGYQAERPYLSPLVQCFLPGASG